MGSAALTIRWAEYLQLLLLACRGGTVQRFKCLKPSTLYIFCFYSKMYLFPEA